MKFYLSCCSISQFNGRLVWWDSSLPLLSKIILNITFKLIILLIFVGSAALSCKAKIAEAKLSFTKSIKFSFSIWYDIIP